MKQCAACRKEKPIAEFSKNRSRKDGLNHTCRDCIAEKREGNLDHFTKLNNESYARNKENVADQRRKYYEADPDRFRTYSYQARYGITLEQFQQMETDQLGACAMCDSFPKKRLNVDHNHQTLKVRGLLCTKCNNGLGFVEDATFMERARRYLAEHAGDQT